ncbi:porin [Paraburkholderia ginsengiterrae]|uniref:Porin n=1 Tax=Paraburkholderia ginsengiterrae TaxID=1462993 RepID=A0A1A9NGW3_9BURK|nr:porin [Paraburkholderia ginsengiterrae]OAJ62245.1 porin [Paraburkholderia ginsengiterrae]OAJ65395.1 porin [Paraburkholderia ginsengiterrae]
MKKIITATAVTATFACAAHAQSSVTLYGIVDAGLTYVSNEVGDKSTLTPDGRVVGGKAVFGMTGGNVQQSRWGLRGAEDLGGGLKAVFNLESGFNIANGGLAASNTLFNRQAYVGLSNEYGTVTLGRQYDSVVDYVAPLTATGSWGGTYFAHPYDNDNANSSVSVNNTIKFQSANYSGFSLGGTYSFSNQAGFANNRAYSVGAGYRNGGFQLGAAYSQFQGINTNQSAGAIQGGVFEDGIQNVRTWGLGGNYAFGPLLVGAVFTQTRFQDKLADISDRYNNYEINARYNLTPALALGAAYTYTQALRATPGTGDSNTGAAHWNQFGLQADYSLSKRTDLYAEAVAQVGANNSRGTNIIQINGTAAPSTGSNQVLVTTGIRHRF